MRRRLRIALAAAMLALAGCGGQQAASDGGPAATGNASSASSPTSSPSSSPSSSTSSSTFSSPSSSPLSSDVPELLDFTATTVGGETFEGASLAGTPTVLWFWAPWCPTCRSQVPQVEDLADTYGDQVGVVGIGSLDSAEAIAEFAGDVDGITHLEDEDGVLWQRFGVAEQSSFVVLDADGIVAFEAGYGGSEGLADEVGSLLD